MTIAKVGFILLLATVAIARAAEGGPPARPDPTRAEVPYGTHARQVLDFRAARTPGLAPPAACIHGGGFSGGSKERLLVGELRALLEAGISVAALHQRFIQHAKLPAAHQDVARAVQFLRSRAGEWQLDKTRVAEISALALLSRDDPPLFMSYGMAPDATPPIERQQLEGWIAHHVAHGVALQRRCQEVGVEVHLKYPGGQTRYASAVEFPKPDCSPCREPTGAGGPAVLGSHEGMGFLPSRICTCSSHSPARVSSSWRRWRSQAGRTPKDAWGGCRTNWREAANSAFENSSPGIMDGWS